MARRMLSLLDRAQITVRVEHRLSDAAIGELIGRGRTGVGQGTTPERVEHPRLSARQRKRARGRPPEAAASAEHRHRPGPRGPGAGGLAAGADVEAGRWPVAAGCR